MQLTAIGLNHQTAPLSIRESSRLPQSRCPMPCAGLIESRAAKAVILSTCNRTELYCVGDAERVIRWLAEYQNLNIDEIRPYLYTYGCSDTIRHAFPRGLRTRFDGVGRAADFRAD